MLNGYEYTVNSVKVKWQGLIFSDGGTNNPLPQSLIANYVYARFLEETAFQNTGIGMAAVQGKNSKRVSASADIAIADNDFYTLAISGDLGMFAGYSSLYDFLGDMNDEDSDNFPTWIPDYDFRFKNRLGL